MPGTWDTYQKGDKSLPGLGYATYRVKVIPGKNGLELARELSGIHPEIKVVFVTAYEKYMREAYEGVAVDYLLKPVRKARVEKALDKLAKSLLC